MHEAVAVDPATGIVYQTEDRWYNEAGFYRFIPDTPGVLTDGGRLQMIAVTDQPQYVTSQGQKQGAVWPVHWVDIADPGQAVSRQGFAAGAARFERLEGAFPGDDGIYFVSTSGGDARAGQVFHYRPTSADAGELRLVFESPSADILDSPDNIVLSPHGGLLLCEDGTGDQFIRELDRKGRIVNLVRGGSREFAGSCFSPDGRVLFFNVQGSRRRDGSTPSATYALWKRQQGAEPEPADLTHRFPARQAGAGGAERAPDGRASSITQQVRQEQHHARKERDHQRERQHERQVGREWASDLRRLDPSHRARHQQADPHRRQADPRPGLSQPKCGSPQSLLFVPRAPSCPAARAKPSLSKPFSC